MRGPKVLGVKVTSKLREAPAARVVKRGMGLVTNSAAFTPSMTQPFIASGEVPRFRSVKVRVTVTPTACVMPKLTLPASATAMGPGRLMSISGVAPAPVRMMSKGFSLASLLATRIVAVRAPRAPGRKTTVNSVVASKPSVVVLSVPRVKSAAFVPVLLKARPVRLAVPLLRIVKV